MNSKVEAERRQAQRKELYISLLAVTGIGISLVAPAPFGRYALMVVLVLGGAPLLWDLLVRVRAGEFGSDLLAAISILSAAVLGEYLVASIVILMLAGGAALESYATRRAASALEALAKRMPRVAHRREGGGLTEIHADSIVPGDELVVFPHEICPVDGAVLEGHGWMDESYLTGEPYEISKTPGCEVLSGARNGDAALTIRATKLAVDSRYARIMRVMMETAQRRPAIRRIGDRLGAWYTVVALAAGAGGWLFSGDPRRFLAVMVIATPCPLLIGIPVAIVAAISLCARRGIIVRNPAALEEIDSCRVILLDKTGTLTYGRPALTAMETAGVEEERVLVLAASVEQYSKHPLALAIVEAARTRRLPLEQAERIQEPPGQGLTGVVHGVEVRLIGRAQAALAGLPEQTSGLECVVLLNGSYAALFRFRDQPRPDSLDFVTHLGPKHLVQRVLLVSGDREPEVRYLAGVVGITEVHAQASPEDKVKLVREASRTHKTLFVGDGVNDAPAMVAATVGVAVGRNDVTSDAADLVLLEPSLRKVDELIHLGRHMRFVALQSAIGGMALSLVGVGAAAMGLLPPLAGAVAQELIDLAAILNSLRAARAPAILTDLD